MAAKTVQMTVSEAREKLTAIFTGLRVPEEDALWVADSLLDAELSGVESHGLMRVKSYADRLAGGNMDPHPDIRIEINGAVALVDGRNGVGQIVTTRAVDTCVQLARKYGIAIASVGHSNHFGTAGFYSTRMAKEGCIGFVASAAGPSMAPHGGLEALLGTNPISIAFPGAAQVFCADFATSAAAKGKIRIYEKKGLSIPDGWAMDAEGNGTNDPAAAVRGILLPMAAHKGYGLAMAVDAMCGLLSGSLLSCESANMVQVDRIGDTAHCVAAVDIAHFLPLEDFQNRAQAWFDRFKASRPRPGFDRVMIPGEPETERKAAAGGVLHVLEKTAAELEECLRKYGRKA